MDKNYKDFFHGCELNNLVGDLDNHKKILSATNKLSKDKKLKIANSLEKDTIEAIVKIQSNPDSKTKKFITNCEYSLSRIFSIFSESEREKAKLTANQIRIFVENIKFIYDVKGKNMANPLKDIKSFFENTTIDYGDDYQLIKEFPKAFAKKTAQAQNIQNPFKRK